MKIVNEVLNEELFQQCKEELKSKFRERCWSSSLVNWQPELKQGITNYITENVDLERLANVG